MAIRHLLLNARWEPTFAVQNIKGDLDALKKDLIISSKIIGLAKHEIRFIDSFKFMASS